MATFGLNLTVGYAGQMSLGQAAFFGIGAYIAAIALKAGVPFLARAADRGGRLLRRRPGAGLSGAARAAPLPRVRHARLQRARVSSSCATRRRSPAARSASRASRGRRCSAISLDGRLAFFYFTLVSLLAARRRCCGGCCARRGDARSRRCATTRSAPRAWASTSPPTRCSPSRSAPRARASAASTSRRSSSSSSPAPFHFSTSLMMLLAVIVGGSGRFFGPVLGTVIIVLLPECCALALVAQVHAELVSRGVRLRRRRADDLAAGRAPVDPGDASQEAEAAK